MTSSPSGGTRGIGSGIASVLAEEGYDLLLTYNTDKISADKFAHSLTDKHGDLKVDCVGGDISLCSTRDEIFDIFDKNEDSRLEVVVHNAGQYVGITSTNCDSIKAKRIQFGDGSLLNDNGQVNFDTMHYYQKMYGDAWVDICERSLVRMKDGPGTIIGISSPGVCAHLYGPDSSYSMPGSGKSLMEYSARIYAMKAAERGINVNIIVPGATFTDAWRRLAKSYGMDNEGEIIERVVEDRIPMKRQTTPQDIGNLVKFLSSSTGRMLTGQVLALEGGLHLRAWQ